MNSPFNATTRAAVIGAVLSLAMLAGCGKGGSAVPSGKYESKFGPPGNGLTLDFVGNNDVDVTISEGGRSQTKRTSFVTSGDSIIVKIPEGEGQDLTLKHNGAALEATMQGMTMHFEKL
jgi:hypothetical protein